MHNSIISSERLIELSRDFVDDVINNKKIMITKEHYYVFALSNFIATKEYFLKKKITGRRTQVVFNENDSSDLLPMVVAFYDNIKSRNKYFKEPTPSEALSKIVAIPNNLSIKEYLALYFFNELRNLLAHPGNYVIKEENNERILLLKGQFGNIIIPVELFDFVAFYMNSYIDDIDPVDIFENYRKYKNSSDSKRYYKFESKSAVKNTVDLLAKAKMLTKQKKLTLEKGKSLSGSATDINYSTLSAKEKYLANLVEDLKDSYGDEADQIIKIINFYWEDAMLDEKTFNYLLHLDIVFRIEKRLTCIKIDKSVKSIKAILRIDKKAAALYSHSIILFSNRKEPTETNSQKVFSDIKKIEKKLLAIDVKKPDNLSDEEKKSILQQYRVITKALLTQLENLIRINEHKYRNSIFHNNIDFNFSTEEIHFWNQKDNTNPQDVHTFDFIKKPAIYNLELKNIEDFNIDIGNITFMELYEILNQYNNEIIDPTDFISKLFSINQIKNGLFKWNMTIDDFLTNIDEFIKELSAGQK